MPDIIKLYEELKNLGTSDVAASSEVQEKVSTISRDIINTKPKNEKEAVIIVRTLIKLELYGKAIGLLIDQESIICLEESFKLAAEIHYLKNEKKEALNILKKGIKECPNSIDILHNYGFLLDEHGDYSEAEKVYRKILEIEPNNVDALNNLAVCLWHRGKYYYPAAIEALEQVSRLNPNCKQSYLNLGILRAANGNYKEAVIEFDKAIALDKNYSRAYYNKGKVLYCLGELNNVVLNLQDAQRKKIAQIKIESGHLKEFKKFSDRDINALVGAIQNSSEAVTHLDLSQNNIKKDGAVYLVSHTSLASLDISGNDVRSAISTIAVNRTLTHLDIRGVKLYSADVNLLASQTTLCELLFDEESLKAEDLKKLRDMLQRNRQCAKDFSSACKAGDLGTIENILKAGKVSPHTHIEGTELNALEFSLQNNNTPLSELLINSYLTYYKPQLAIFKLIVNILRRNKAYLEKVQDARLGIEEVLKEAVQGCNRSIAMYAALGLRQFRLKDITIDEFEAETLAEILKANPSITSLYLENVVFTDAGYSKFIEALSYVKDNLKNLSLVNSGIRGDRLKELNTKISSYKSLVTLNLNRNSLDYNELRRILKSLTSSKQLQELFVQENNIDVVDSEAIYELEHLIRNANIKSLHIMGNLFSGEPRDKQLVDVLEMLLKRTGLSVDEFLNVDFVKSVPAENNGYKFKFYCPKGFLAVNLDKEDLRLFNMLKTAKRGLSTDADVWNYLTSEIAKRKSEIPEEILKTKVNSVSDGENQNLRAGQKSAIKSLADYHSQAPIKSYLKTYSFFKSSEPRKVTSLLFDNDTVSHDDWKVYLIARKSHEHALLGYEGINGLGQRIFKVAHLTADNNGKISISFYQKGNITDFVAELKQKYTIAKFSATREQVKEMDKRIRKETEEKSDAQFKKVLSEFHQSKRDSDKVLNCLKWAVLKLKHHIGIDLDINFYHPSRVVKEINSHPERIIKQKSNPVSRQTSPRLEGRLGA